MWSLRAQRRPNPAGRILASLRLLTAPWLSAQHVRGTGRQLRPPLDLRRRTSSPSRVPRPDHSSASRDQPPLLAGTAGASPVPSRTPPGVTVGAGPDMVGSFGYSAKSRITTGPVVSTGRRPDGGILSDHEPWATVGSDCRDLHASTKPGLTQRIQTARRDRTISTAASSVSPVAVTQSTGLEPPLPLFHVELRRPQRVVRSEQPGCERGLASPVGHGDDTELALASSGAPSHSGLMSPGDQRSRWTV